MKAILISTKGSWLEAIIEIEGNQYCVIDELTHDVNTMPELGESFEIEFTNMLDDNEEWESIFQSNPEKKQCLEQVEGWKYRAYGKVISIDPVVVDCGILQEEDVINTHDQE